MKDLIYKEIIKHIDNSIIMLGKQCDGYTALRAKNPATDKELTFVNNRGTYTVVARANLNPEATSFYQITNLFDQTELKRMFTKADVRYREHFDNPMYTNAHRRVLELLLKSNSNVR